MVRYFYFRYWTSSLAVEGMGCVPHGDGCCACIPAESQMIYTDVTRWKIQEKYLASFWVSCSLQSLPSYPGVVPRCRSSFYFILIVLNDRHRFVCLVFMSWRRRCPCWVVSAPGSPRNVRRRRTWSNEDSAVSLRAVCSLRWVLHARRSYAEVVASRAAGYSLPPVVCCFWGGVKA